MIYLVAILWAGLVWALVSNLMMRIGARQAEHERRHRISLERWLRGNLMAIRAECAFISPQAASVVNSLECAFSVLQPVDIHGLRRDLARIGREHDAHLIEETQHWCKVRADIAAEAAKGEPLPGMEGPQ